MALSQAFLASGEYVQLQFPHFLLAVSYTHLDVYKRQRIFIHASQSNDQFCEIRIRNTSRVPLDFDPEEITKRFVRGEKARTGEGSGLGLAIAKTYTESCGGQFHIVIEDDCFIAVVDVYKRQAYHMQCLLFSNGNIVPRPSLLYRKKPWHCLDFP